MSQRFGEPRTRHRAAGDVFGAGRGDGCVGLPRRRDRRLAAERVAGRVRLMLALRRMVSNHPRGLQSSKVSRDRNARSNVSCTRSSASYPLPVTARATRNVRNDDHVEPDVRGRRSSVGLIRPHLVAPRIQSPPFHSQTRRGGGSFHRISTTSDRRPSERHRVVEPSAHTGEPPPKETTMPTTTQPLTPTLRRP